MINRRKFLQALGLSLIAPGIVFSKDSKASHWDEFSETATTIGINADGLEPELEAFMWKIFERIQIHATQSGAKFPVGISC